MSPRRWLGRLRSRQRVLLTGTPVQNNVNELLSLLSFMLPATFPPELALAFADASSSRARLSDAEVGRLRRLLAPFILRRLKAHVLTQLVPKVEEEALDLYAQVDFPEYAESSASAMVKLHVFQKAKRTRLAEVSLSRSS